MLSSKLLALTFPLTALAAVTPLTRDVDVSPRSIAPRWSPICKVEPSSEPEGNSSPAFQRAAEECANGGTILFEEGVDYHLLDPINATLRDVDIQIQGNLHLPQSIEYIQNVVNATSDGRLYWISLEGSNIWITGSTNITQGWINCYGQQWWDANPEGQAGTPLRPRLMQYTVQGGQITNWKVKKPIAWATALRGDSIYVNNAVIDANTRPGGGFPFNTDGFGVSASNVLIENFVIANGDDAVTINNGAENVTARNGLIGGPGCHGMSVGSLGRDPASPQYVKNIHFDNIQVEGALYAARFKSWLGGQGTADNIVWSNFKIQNVTYPVYVTQQYFDQDVSDGQGRPDNSSLILSNFKWTGWKGMINSYLPGDASCVTDPCWYDLDVPDADGTQSILIQCRDAESCTGFEVSDFQVVPEVDEMPTVICKDLSEESHPNLGFACQNGTFIPTV